MLFWKRQITIQPLYIKTTFKQQWGWCKIIRTFSSKCWSTIRLFLHIIKTQQRPQGRRLYAQMFQNGNSWEYTVFLKRIRNVSGFIWQKYPSEIATKFQAWLLRSRACRNAGNVRLAIWLNVARAYLQPDIKLDIFRTWHQTLTLKRDCLAIISATVWLRYAFRHLLTNGIHISSFL